LEINLTKQRIEQLEKSILARLRTRIGKYELHHGWRATCKNIGLLGYFCDSLSHFWRRKEKLVTGTIDAAHSKSNANRAESLKFLFW